jgi:DNA-binding NarL/FixJ family response regulator
MPIRAENTEEKIMSVKLLVADDHQVVRAGLATLLADSDVEIVAEAESGAEALKMAVKHKPDVVLLDIRMSDDGLEALDKIHRAVPNTRVVMLSTYDNPTYVARAVALGASDYVLKGASRQQLISTITGAAADRSPSNGGELQRVAGAMSKNHAMAEDETNLLTKRETQVLRHVALGLSNKEIAQSLTISIETVKEHVQNILRKIGLTDRTQAAVWAVRKGIV